MKDFSSLTFIIILTFCVNIDSKLTSFLKINQNIFSVFQQVNSTELISKFTFSNITAKCFINSNSSIFDINLLSNPLIDYSPQARDGNFLKLNFCNKPIFTCPNSTGLISYNSSKGCVSLSGNSIYSNYSYSYDKILKLNTLNAILPLGDSCLSNPKLKYQTTLKYICDSKTKFALDAKSFDINQCSNTIEVRSLHVCPKDNVYGLWESLEECSFVVGMIFFTFGLYMCFLSKKFYNLTQLLSGVLVVFISIFYLVLYQLQIEIQLWCLILCSVFSIVSGLILGYFFAKTDSITKIVLSGTSGFYLGLLIYHVGLKEIQVIPVQIFWLTITIFTCVGILLGLFENLKILIGSLSIIGAYTVIRGLAYMIGYFPDERQLYDLLKNQEYFQVSELSTWHFYLYFCLIILIAAFSFFVQFKYFSSDEERLQNRLITETNDKILKEKMGENLRFVGEKEVFEEKKVEKINEGTEKRDDIKQNNLIIIDNNSEIDSNKQIIVSYTEIIEAPKSEDQNQKLIPEDNYIIIEKESKMESPYERIEEIQKENSNENESLLKK